MTNAVVRSLPALAVKINDAHASATSAAFSALEHARRAGDLLIEAKDQLQHGEWLPWLGEHCPTLSVRTVQGYMRLARCWPQLESTNTQRVAHLPVRKALALLAHQRSALVADLNNADEDEDYDAWLAAIRSDLALLDRMVKLPDLTAAEMSAIVRRATALEEEASGRRLRALYALGKLQNRIHADYGPDMLAAMVDYPDKFRAMVDKRIAELEAAE